MGFVDEALKLKGAPGMVLLALGAAVLAPVVLPVLGSALKPVIKNGIKSGLILYQKSRELAAEALESLEDITAEAKAEMLEEQK